MRIGALPEGRADASSARKFAYCIASRTLSDFLCAAKYWLVNMRPLPSLWFRQLAGTWEATVPMRHQHALECARVGVSLTNRQTERDPASRWRRGLCRLSVSGYQPGPHDNRMHSVHCAMLSVKHQLHACRLCVRIVIVASRPGLLARSATRGGIGMLDAAHSRSVSYYPSSVHLCPHFAHTRARIPSYGARSPRHPSRHRTGRCRCLA